MEEGQGQLEPSHAVAMVNVHVYIMSHNIFSINKYIHLHNIQSVCIILYNYTQDFCINKAFHIHTIQSGVSISGSEIPTCISHWRYLRLHLLMIRNILSYLGHIGSSTSSSLGLSRLGAEWKHNTRNLKFTTHVHVTGNTDMVCNTIHVHACIHVCTCIKFTENCFKLE